MRKIVTLLILLLVVVFLFGIVIKPQAAEPPVKIRLCLFAWDKLDYETKTRHITYHCYMLGNEPGNFCELEPWQTAEEYDSETGWTNIGYWYMCEEMGVAMFMPLVLR